jgi:NAD-dependent SIR2 family protein deacetylase
VADKKRTENKLVLLKKEQKQFTDIWRRLQITWYTTDRHLLRGELLRVKLSQADGKHTRIGPPPGVRVPRLMMTPQDAKRAKDMLMEIESFKVAPGNRCKLDKAMKLINGKKIVAIVGAGMSKAAGIPTFRGANGVYNKKTEKSLSTDTFNNNKKRGEFFMVLNELLPKSPTESHMPTHAHRFLKRLCDDDRIIRIYTQNIDCLEKAAEIPDGLIVQCHGTVETGSCYAKRRGGKRTCKATYDKTFMVDAMQTMRRSVIGKNSGIVCTTCNEATVRHDITLFGEPVKIMEKIVGDIEKASTLLVIGTSLAVDPIAEWVKTFNGPIIIIDERAQQLVFFRASFPPMLIPSHA